MWLSSHEFWWHTWKIYKRSVLWNSWPTYYNDIHNKRLGTSNLTFNPIFRNKLQKKLYMWIPICKWLWTLILNLIKEIVWGFLYLRTYMQIQKALINRNYGTGNSQFKEWQKILHSNLVKFLVTLKLFLNAKCSLSLCHGKWFLSTNLFLFKPFLITDFNCILWCIH